VDLGHLAQLLERNPAKTIVSIMHANNEIGNMIDLHKVGTLCKNHNAYFHSDTVQTVGHFPFNLKETPVDFITGAGHKFHGPKGVGILYINENIKINPLVHGGAQERNMRAGTENLYGIVGFAKALELATEHYEKDSASINELRKYMHTQLLEQIPGVSFNGDTFGDSLYTLLSVNFPKNEKSEMMLFNLDIHHICASGGSACSSGAQQGSHVINALNKGEEIATVRFSFCKHNTKAEIDQVIATLKTLL
jgi:cysteine desulfurase